MNFADLLLCLLLVSAFLGSCYFLRSFFLSWQTADLQRNLANPLLASWGDFALYLAGFALVYWKAHNILLLYSLGSIIVLLIVRGQPPFVFWNLKAVDFPKYLRVGFKTYIAIFLPFGLLTWACNSFFFRLGFDVNQPAMEIFMRLHGFMPILNFLLFACVAAPIWEEITFRGFLYPFLKNKIGRNAALFLSAFLFAAMHLHVPSFIPLAALGLLLTLLYERTGSLGYNILLHASFNFSTCLIVLLLKYGSNPRLLRALE